MEKNKNSVFSFFQKKFAAPTSETNITPQIRIDDKGRKLMSFSTFGQTAEVMVPAFAEIRNKSLNRKIISIGDDNLFPDFLNYILNTSPKHGAIVQQKGTMITGEGFAPTEDVVLNQFYANPFGDETLKKILPKSALDFVLYNYCALMVTWAKNRENVARVEYLDASTIRYMRNEKSDDSKTRAEQEDEGPQMIAVCNDWRNYGTNSSKWMIYPEFSKENFDENPTQILVIKRHYPRCEYYSAPTYISGIAWALLESMVAQFHTRNIQQGFTPSMIMSFIGNPTSQEMEQNEAELKRQYQGVKGAGRVIIMYSQDKDSMPEVTPIVANDSDERYAALMESITEGIMTSHQITNPALFGIAIPGKLGATSADELLFSFQQYQKTVIHPFQVELEDQLTMLAKYNGAQEEVKIIPYNMT